MSFAIRVNQPTSKANQATKVLPIPKAALLKSQVLVKGAPEILEAALFIPHEKTVSQVRRRGSAIVLKEVVFGDDEIAP